MGDRLLYVRTGDIAVVGRVYGSHEYDIAIEASGKKIRVRWNEISKIPKVISCKVKQFKKHRTFSKRKAESDFLFFCV